MLYAILLDTGAVRPGKTLPRHIHATPATLPQHAKALAQDILTEGRISFYAGSILGPTAGYAFRQSGAAAAFEPALS